LVRTPLACFEEQPELLRTQKMVRDGIPFVVVPLVIALICAILAFWLVWFWIGVGLSILLTAFMAYFFRNPRRSIPLEPGIIVAPADGKVTIARQATAENPEALVSIFLSPLDVHINRSPIEGEIVDITYKKGRFLMATKEESRLHNEQNCLTIVGSDVTVKCVQIAGVLARRIVCWKQRGERVKCGEQFGMIKFSSRTDLLMPSNVEVMVNVGTHVKGGETIIGRIKN
jgi:phosphatidylserine decarboxylase